MIPTAERFLRSALSEESRFQTTEEAMAWLRSTGTERLLLVRQIPLADLGEWSFDRESGDLVHQSGKFFRVRGIRTKTDLGPVSEWDQPIIDQPEIGILGIIAREIEGQLYLLMQAKMEPGNPMGVQLTPTVQATRSNYTQVHQGSRPPYLEYFLEPGRSRVLVDQLQLEQGSAFLRKRNRNIVVEVAGEIPVLEGFRWFTLGQVKKLLAVPNVVSMDTRTVLACMPLVTGHSPGRSRGQDLADLNDFTAGMIASFGAEVGAATDDEVLGWLTDLRCRYQLVVEDVGLRRIRGWRTNDLEIAHEEGRYLRILGVEVEADSREVLRWSQPLIGSVEQGLVAFVVAEMDGVPHFLAQGRVEPGGADTVMVGPTVQCALGYERRGDQANRPPFLDIIEYPASGRVLFSCVQSEEGGRFYRVENEYRIVQIDAAKQLEIPPNFTWMTGRQLQELLRFGMVTVEARSLLACLSFT